jgi:hypothetical protein
MLMANFNYVEPKKVTSPRDYVRQVIPIFDGTKEIEKKGLNHTMLDNFSLAILQWKDEYTLGIRWNLTMREDQDPDKQNGIKQVKECLFPLDIPFGSYYLNYFTNLF